MEQYSNFSGVMEVRDHFKSGAAPKNQTSKGNFLCVHKPKNYKTNRLIFLCLTAVLCVFLVSCRTLSKSSPSYAASKIGNALLEGDKETVINYLYLDKELTMTFKGISITMPLEFTFENELMEIPITKFKVLSEKISDDGRKAVVTVKTTLKDGTSEIFDTDFVKTDDGWKIKFSME